MDNTLTVNELIELLCKVRNPDTKVIIESRRADEEVNRRAIDVSFDSQNIIIICE